MANSHARNLARVIRGDYPVPEGALANAQAFPVGTLMLFQQSTAPTGWTKQTTHNDKALRVTNGTVGSGGSAAFSTALGTPSVSGNISVSGHTMSVSEMAIHNHSHGFTPYGGGGQPNAVTSNGANETRRNAINNEGGGAAHSHGANHNFTTNISVSYVDIIIASKD